MVAYAATKAGATEIWVKPIAGGDSIQVGLYNYETDKRRAVGGLLDRQDGEFSEDLVGYSHADVLAMREDGMILDVRDR